MKIVKEQKRVERRNLVKSEGSLQMNASSFNGRFAFQYFLYSSHLAHGRSPFNGLRKGYPEKREEVNKVNTVFHGEIGCIYLKIVLNRQADGDVIQIDFRRKEC